MRKMDERMRKKEMETDEFGGWSLRAEWGDEWGGWWMRMGTWMEMSKIEN